LKIRFKNLKIPLPLEEDNTLIPFPLFAYELIENKEIRENFIRFKVNRQEIDSLNLFFKK